ASGGSYAALSVRCEVASSWPESSSTKLPPSHRVLIRIPPSPGRLIAAPEDAGARGRHGAPGEHGTASRGKWRSWGHAASTAIRSDGRFCPIHRQTRVEIELASPACRFG